MNENKALWIPLLVAVISAVPGLLTLIFTWLRDRNILQKRNQALEHATKLVAFLESWVRTQQLVQSPEQFEEVQVIAKHELDKLLKTLSTSSITDLSPFTSDSSYNLNKLSVSTRHMLLLYLPQGIGGALVHALFYVNFILFVIATYFRIYAIIDHPSRVKEHLSVFLISYAIIFFPLIIWHTLAVRIQSRMPPT